jgi:hypothetical protein
VFFFVFSALLAAALGAAPARADMIEVKGRGVFSGRVLSDEGGKVVFKNSWGETMTLDKNDVIFMQQGGSAPAQGGKTGPSLPRVPAFSLESIIAPFRGGNTIEALHKSAKEFFGSALDYLTGDAEGVTDILKGAGKHVMATSSKKFTAQNYGSGAGGIALIGIGLISTAAFSFMLIFNAFEQGFLWGVAFLADGLVFLSPVFGGTLGLVLVLPYFLSVYFVVRYWEDARVAVVGQLFSLNIVTLGYIIMKGAFSWS